MVDIIDVALYFEKQGKAVKELLVALTTQMRSESGHLERLEIFEKEAAEDDDMPLDEGKLAANMEAHKSNSPFALDVAAAKAKWEGTVEG